MERFFLTKHRFLFLPRRSATASPSRCPARPAAVDIFIHHHHELQRERHAAAARFSAHTNIALRKTMLARSDRSLPHHARASPAATIAAATMAAAAHHGRTHHHLPATR
jgi:hypothetical protein